MSAEHRAQVKKNIAAMVDNVGKLLFFDDITPLTTEEWDDVAQQLTTAATLTKLLAK